MFRPIAGLLALALLAAAAPAPVRAADSTITIAQGVDADTLNPIATTITPTFNIVQHVYERLLDYDTPGHFTPKLAVSWKRINPTTEEYKLRPNVKFSNGDPFTSADVKYTIEWIKNPANHSTQTSYVRDIDKVETPDPLTVRFISSKPTAIAPGQTNIVFIVDAKYFQEKGNDYVAEHPIGTGPYVLHEWRHDDQISFDVNPTWWGGKPKIQHVIFKPIPEAAARVAALKTGAVDVITNVPPQYADSIEHSSTTRIASTRSGRELYIAFNTLKPGPQQNKLVRQAFNYAVNVPAIVKAVLGGYGYPLTTVVPTQYVGFAPSVAGYHYDPAKARELLAKAGYPGGKGLTMTLYTPTGRYSRDREVAEAVAGQLNAIGAQVTVRSEEWTTYIGQADRRELAPMYELGWNQPAADADGVFTPLLESNSPLAVDNVPALDKLIDEGRGELDPVKRKKIYEAAAKLERDEALWIVLFQFEDLYGVSRRVVWQPRGDEYIRAYEMSLK